MTHWLLYVIYLPLNNTPTKARKGEALDDKAHVCTTLFPKAEKWSWIIWSCQKFIHDVNIALPLQFRNHCVVLSSKDSLLVYWQLKLLMVIILKLNVSSGVIWHSCVSRCYSNDMKVPSILICNQSSALPYLGKRQHGSFLALFQASDYCLCGIITNYE